MKILQLLLSNSSCFIPEPSSIHLLLAFGFSSFRKRFSWFTKCVCLSTPLLAGSYLWPFTHSIRICNVLNKNSFAANKRHDFPLLQNICLSPVEIIMWKYWTDESTCPILHLQLLHYFFADVLTRNSNYAPSICRADEEVEIFRPPSIFLALFLLLLLFIVVWMASYWII